MSTLLWTALLGCANTNGTQTDGKSELVYPSDLIYEGEVIVTEIGANPAAVPDWDGEWIEVYNNSGYTFNLEGLVIEDAAKGKGKLSDVVIGPKEYAVIGRGSVDDWGYQDWRPDGYWGNTPALNNDGDTLRLFSPRGTLIDAAPWLAPEVAGSSLQLSADKLDAEGNDNKNNWCQSGYEFEPTGETATPGMENDLCEGDVVPTCGFEETVTVFVEDRIVQEVAAGEQFYFAISKANTCQDETLEFYTSRDCVYGVAYATSTDGQEQAFHNVCGALPTQWEVGPGETVSEFFPAPEGLLAGEWTISPTVGTVAEVPELTVTE